MPDPRDRLAERGAVEVGSRPAITPGGTRCSRLTWSPRPWLPRADPTAQCLGDGGLSSRAQTRPLNALVTAALAPARSPDPRSSLVAAALRATNIQSSRRIPRNPAPPASTFHRVPPSVSRRCLAIRRASIAQASAWLSQSATTAARNWRPIWISAAKRRCPCSPASPVRPQRALGSPRSACRSAWLACRSLQLCRSLPGRVKFSLAPSRA
jgi:hypothetical protein